MDVKEQLEKIARDRGASEAGLEAGAKAFALGICEALQVKPEEVAILLLTSTEQSLKFVWPPALSHGNAVFPANHKNAVASGVLATMRGKVDNRLAESKHLKFYENIRGMECSGLPIQKMVALPMVAGERAVGVLEVSRKGKTPEESGPNFTSQDAQLLVGLCKACVPLLAQLIPKPFF
jgi:hypothetical protein